MHRGLSILALAAIAIPRAAWADASACTTAAEDGQRALAAKRLHSAKLSFLVCADPACPAIVRNDCVQWAAQTERNESTIVIAAKDAAGRDTGDVIVAVDDVVIAEQLDGTAIAIDPGAHRLRFEHDGAHVNIDALIQQGVKNRVFEVSFARAPTIAAPTQTTTVHVDHTILPWVFVGLGGVAAAVGIGFLITAPAFPASCSKDAGQCAPLPGGTTDDEQASRSDNANRIGEILIVAGAVVVTGGLVWHFLEPTQRTTHAHLDVLAPWATASGGGLTARGAF